jgi:hypothetical protein
VTSDELKLTADGARDAIALANPGLIVLVIVAQPDPEHSLFATATNTPNVGDATKLLRCARIALAGS